MLERRMILTTLAATILLRSAALAGSQTVTIGGQGGKGGDASVTIIIIPKGGDGGAGGNVLPPTVPRTTAPSSQSTSNTAFSIRDNRDIEGNDIPMSGAMIGVAGMDMSGCQNLCASLENCVAYSYDRWNNRCFPKNKLSETNLDAHSSIGVKKPGDIPPVSKVEARWAPFSGKRLRGTMFSNTRTDTADQCRGDCWAELRCVGYAFNKTASGPNCTQFKLIDGYDPDAAYASGVKTQTPERSSATSGSF